MYRPALVNLIVKWLGSLKACPGHKLIDSDYEALFDEFVDLRLFH